MAESLIFTPGSVAAILAGQKRQTRRLVAIPKLRVRLPSVVKSEDLGIGHLGTIVPNAKVKPGSYYARLNQHGAVTVQAAGGMGVKPGEFHFICPYVDGDTTLARSSVGAVEKSKWLIVPTVRRTLWVKEKWRTHERPGDGVDGIVYANGTFAPIENTAAAAELWIVARDNDRYGEAFRNPMYMPRWASRIDLDVMSIALERLYDIDEVDARAELGTEEPPCTGELPLEVIKYLKGRPWAQGFLFRWSEIHGIESVKANPWLWCIKFNVAKVKETTKP